MNAGFFSESVDCETRYFEGGSDRSMLSDAC